MQGPVVAHPVEIRLINADLNASDWNRTEMAPGNHNVSLAQSQDDIINSANPSRALDDGVQYGLHVRGRPADDAEHLGCRGLMFQRLAQFRIALLQFFEQPHVFDGDHGLGGECFEKLDLLLCERANLFTADMNRPDRNSLAHYRGGKHILSYIDIHT